MRQKLRTDDAAGGQVQDGSQADQSGADGKPARVDGPPYSRAIPVRHKRQHRIAPLARILAEQDARKNRRQEHGEYQRAQQRKGHRPGHRLEKAPLHGLQCKDRKISGNDDGDREENGALHLVCGFADALHRRSVSVAAAGAAQVPDDVLHHHHGAIHHHAEIQRSQ